jgi:MoxR-like ATPase
VIADAARTANQAIVGDQIPWAGQATVRDYFAAYQTGGTMNPTTAQHQIQRLSESLHQVIVGRRRAPSNRDRVIADGHVLLEGAQGLAKTTLVWSPAELLSLAFGRVQCTPDLMPSDVAGTMMLL